MRKRWLRIYIYFLCILVCGGVASCTQREDLRADKYRESQVLMGTTVHIDVCQENQNKEKVKLAYKVAWERLEDIAWRMNVLDERSDVSKINQAGLKPVAIGADTYEVLQRAVYYSKITGGAFDITVWPLIKLWKHSEKIDRLPTDGEILNIKKMIGMNNIELLADNFIKRLNLQTQIDLGGIAKGYAVDEVARIFREHEVSDFFIDAGGDIYVGGQNCSGGPWRIGIRDPRDRSKIIDVVEVTNGAVATSGNYEQFTMIKGERWSHIIDPISGYPQKDVISATVIAPSAMEADALATALCVLGGGSGTQLMNTLTKNYASLIIVKDKSNQIKRYLNKTYANFSKGGDAINNY